MGHPREEGDFGLSSAGHGADGRPPAGQVEKVGYAAGSVSGAARRTAAVPTLRGSPGGRASSLGGPRTHKIVIEEFCQIGRLEIKFGR